MYQISERLPTKANNFPVLEVEEKSSQSYIMTVPLATFSRNIWN